MGSRQEGILSNVVYDLMAHNFSYNTNAIVFILLLHRQLNSAQKGSLHNQPCVLNGYYITKKK